jgi:hypothetical protein
MVVIHVCPSRLDSLMVKHNPLISRESSR